jgi:hypothetical protein
MQKTDPSSVSEAVAKKHFETIRIITKCFTDRENENFAQCSPYTPLLAWATQFYYLTEHARNELKVESGIRTLEREIESKE